jgi:hypothetical protein
VLRQLAPRDVFRANQDDLDPKLTCGLHRASDRNSRRMVAAHDIERNFHDLLL